LAKLVEDLTWLGAANDSKDRRKGTARRSRDTFTVFIFFGKES